MRLSGGLSQSPTTTSTSASRRIFLALLTTTSLVNGTWAASSRNKTNAGKQLQTPADMSYYNALDDTFLIPPSRCPPCFNCLLPAFTCGQYGFCNTHDGQCKCPAGWGGIDCLTPQCDSLADGDQRQLRKEGQPCDCKEGWGGINCNVCQTDEACIGFPLAGGIHDVMSRFSDGDGDDDDEEQKPANMTCYKGGKTVFNNHQMCDVTNRKILDQLPGRPPQVTFSCDSSKETCAFQFWTAQVESFYCALEECESKSEPGYDFNTTSYACDKIRCKCVPGRFICGENGSVDIGEFLEESIRGPATFSCRTGRGCRFEEPAMNELINDVFGDSYITLQCQGGECLHYSQVPGYVRPPKPDNTLWIALSAAGAGGFALLTAAIIWYAGRTGGATGNELGKIRLPDNEATKLMTDHVPASLQFDGIRYVLGGSAANADADAEEGEAPGFLGKLFGGSKLASATTAKQTESKLILDNISGSVKPGQVMAIMGASGAGKSTFLDILARKRKRGSVAGRILVNGREVGDSEFRSVTGYVDQEDTLMSTLTVYETVLYSALLRLPREMSFEAKKFRTLETMNELGILGIRDARIGESGKRSISGGEKRRVSIACELVTSPSILFLDEPTSGLDAYNAYNVVDSLVSLARNYNRTVIFTIHQPRSNIVALFDQLVVLAQGKLVYSGEFAKCQEYFEGIGKPCPAGFNIADYLIDLTMQASLSNTDSNKAPQSSSSSAIVDASAAVVPVVNSSDTSSLTGVTDEERGFAIGSSFSLDAIQSSSRGAGTGAGAGSVDPAILEAAAAIDQEQNESKASLEYAKKKASLLLETLSLSSKKKQTAGRNAGEISKELRELVEAYERSDVAEGIRRDMLAVRREVERVAGAQDQPITNPLSPRSINSAELPDVAIETALLRGRKRASYATQFRILSGRAFKNLYRDPALLAAHYLSSVGLAFICGLFFHNVTNDIAGFQNRLGIFFFTLALFGFSCLSSLGLFANERILFMRERSNGYYSSFTYFASKVLFDILPLRLVPPLMFGGIVYGLVGLVPEPIIFWKFMLTLVLFNLTTASVVLWLSIAFASISVASLVGTLVMLFNLLFTGLLINRETVVPVLQWLHTVSFFHAAFEALAVNELRYLQLKEIKYGVELDVPAATILSVFGLHAQSFWWPNISLLAIFFVTFTTASYITLHYFVKEKR